MRYFAKKNIQILPGGLAPKNFVELMPGYGHLATDDAKILEVIDKNRGRYGFFEITEAQYNEAAEWSKKNPSVTASPRGSPRNVLPQLAQPGRSPAAVAAATEKPVTETPAPASPVQSHVEAQPTVRRNPLLKKTA